jgi:hypothetical protein
MTPDDAPDLKDVMVTTEEVHPDRHEHAKQSKHLDDDELERLTEHEREIVDAQQAESEK